MLEINEEHDCKPPHMVLWYKAVTMRTGLFGRKKEITYEPVYDQRDARWTCPECGALWDWLIGLDIASWMCRERPENWVKKEV